MAQTLIEKIAQRYAVGLPTGHEVHAGDFLSIQPAHVMTHDNTSAVIPKFASIGAKKVRDPRQPVFALDHDIQNRADDNLAKYAKIEQFARDHDIAFYPAGRGIGHQIMIEEGFVLPGSFVVASDSHSNIYGGLAALGTPVVRTDAAAIWATGRTWWQVPDIVKVNLTGRLSPGATGKDVIIVLCGLFNSDEVLNCCIEFAGRGVATLSIEERLAIANMTTEWGALAGVFPYDQATREYLLARAEAFQQRGDQAPRLTAGLVAKIEQEAPRADEDAYYAKTIELDLAGVTPHVSGPDTVKLMAALPEIESRHVKIDKAYLMSCVNGRLQDFAAAAAVIKGRRVAPGVELYIAAASDEIERQAREQGYWQALVDAGAIELPPGCGACIGLGQGLLEAGQVGISATNRNFKGRMGSRDASVYLASPAVVAASAVLGHVGSPARLTGQADLPPRRLADFATCRRNPPPAASPQQVEILPGFPTSLAGELLLVPADNLNTDGIYGKDYTYRELPPDEMAKVAMANYDPTFQSIAGEGDLLVGGYNFGTGSSREQAATALKYRGIQLIIAGSFSQTYKRNAFNNGYVCIECPELVDELRAAHQDDDRATIRTGRQATVDFRASTISVSDGGATRSFAFAALGRVAQELVVRGGFEALIREQLKS